MRSHAIGLLLLTAVVVLPGCLKDEISSPVQDISGTTSASLSLEKTDSQGGPNMLYSENFAKSARGWVKVDGPGALDVVGGVYKHTTPGYSVWCQYTYAPTKFSNATYELDLFIDSQTLATSFGWRAADLQTVTANGGAYQVSFNNSGLAPGPAGHFTVEKFDPQGRTMLLDIPNQFLGLNRLVIEDRGSSITVSINGVKYGTIDVRGLSVPQSGYIYLIGGDRGAGDYFDNIKIKRF